MERLRWEARTQWAYMVFSLSLFWWMLSVVEERFPGNWFGHAAMACVLLTGLGFTFMVVVPRKVVQAMIRQPSWKMKLALMANYLTAILAIRIFTTTWNERAFILIGMFFTTWIAGWLLSRVVWPMKEEFTEFYRDTPDNQHDPTARQGEWHLLKHLLPQTSHGAAFVAFGMISKFGPVNIEAWILVLLAFDGSGFASTGTVWNQISSQCF